MVYRFAIPTSNQEPIINLSEQLEIDENIGVIFFDEAKTGFVNNVTDYIKKLDIDGKCEIKFKYNTDDKRYSEAVDTLVKQEKCQSILITDSKYYSELTDIANDYKDTNFYVLWGKDEYRSSTPDNVQICRVDITKAVYSIGVNSAHYLTEKIKGIDVTDPAFSEINHTVLYLYKTDAAHKLYDQFASGVKTINPNLAIYSVKIENEAAYAQQLAQSNDICAVMLAEEMPEFITTLTEANPDNVYLSGTTVDVTKYPEYLCAVTIDTNTYIDYIFHSISSNKDLVQIHNGTYEDSFCRLEYNKSIIGKLK